MSIQSQTHLKIKVLLTGGDGDLASYISNNLDSSFDIYKPSVDELDVTSIDSVKNYFEDVFFDIVVNLAGTLYSSVIKDSEPDKWIRDINVNLIGAYLVCREAIISNPKVRIINISSTAAYNSYGDWTSYCASKSAVLKLSGGLNKDGYDVITMCPGAINTSLRDGLKINNNSVMSINEGALPIMKAINGEYSSGNIIFYRKGTLEIMKHECR